jgi:ribosome assembly protein RRB1
MLGITAHEADVNVISWNASEVAPFLMASGSDDGSFKIWDLREFDAYVATDILLCRAHPNRVQRLCVVYRDRPVAHFKYHSMPITSVEWHPKDENTLVVASEDDQVTLWDLSVEEDVDAVAAAGAGGAKGDDPGLPSQLLFIHMGQKHVKEAHFHPQLSDVIITTAFTGINIFKPDIQVKA